MVVGGGHSGLAMSKQLTDRMIDHVVLERGAVWQSWRSQRWDSFTMLTPNRQTRLPGAPYDGDDTDGFMAKPQILDFIDAYAAQIAAPMVTETTVRKVRGASAGRYEVLTDQGPWSCRCVVLAGGACALPRLPAVAEAVPSAVDQVHPLEYRSPDQLDEGGVLVVGAAATGMQLAEEIHASGRPVTLSVGEHVRLPRTYRGRDIQHWMELIGRLDERYDEVENLRKARRVASPQLVGSADRRTLDLNHLAAAGVRVRGRLGAIRDDVALFSGGLRNHCALADQKLGRLLDDIDEWIDRNDVPVPRPPERPEPTAVDRTAPLTLTLGDGEICTVVWATGFERDHSWIDLPVFDGDGRIRHDGGVVDAPGVYLLGGNLLRRRKSSFLLGAADDSADLAEHLVGYLAGSA